MPVMDVRLVQRVFARQQAHQHGRLPVQRPAVRHRGEHAPAGCKPFRRARDDGARILDVLENMPKHDVVEAPGG